MLKTAMQSRPTKTLEERWLFVWTVVTVMGSEGWVNTLTEGVLFV